MHPRTMGTFTRLLLILTAVTLLAGIASASVSGAIYTTTSTGTTVNGNIYANKSDVYLSGGPQNTKDPGLVPDGLYYFQVTDPSGAVLLSTDDVTCRQVQVTGGRVAGVPTGSPPASCTTGFHANGTLNDANGALPVQLIPYDDTPNPGGEYKAWMTPVANYGEACTGPSHVSHGFCDADSKTDNFKVKKAVAAYVAVCKFNDLNANGTQDSSEPLIPFWPITGAGVDTLSGPIGTINAQTDSTGCVSFSVSDFSTTPPATGGVVTLTEGTLTAGEWQQTAPPDGTYTVPDGNPNTNATVTVTVANGVETLTLAAGDSVNALNFGNTCLVSACGGNTVQLTVTKDANPSLTRTYTWGITKSVNTNLIDTNGNAATFNYTVNVTHDSGTDSGWQVTGTIKVSNSSLIDITGVTVTDAVDDGGSCNVTGGTNITVPAQSFVNVPYTCTYSALPNPGTNTATASWDSSSATGTASINFTGAAVNVVDSSVNVTDTFGGTLGTVSYTDPSPTTYTYSHTFSGDPAGTCTSHVNTATFATNTTGTTGNASQTVKDCQGADLTVSKTATPSFTRTYNWTINKTVDNNNVKTAGGTAATASYTVTAAEAGFTDSAWQVTGTITVTNPNDWEAITANVADSIDNSGTCTVSGGTNVSVPAHDFVPLNYTCTYASAPSPAAFNNTAIATWDNVAFSTPHGSASGGASGAFSSPTSLVNQTITVTDNFNGSPTTVGTLKATDTTPYTTATYNYPHTVNATAGKCATFPNTATIVETGQTASASVQDCQGADLQVSKTASARFTSGISKSVNQTKVEQSGGNITFNYTVTVAESAWTVSGSITVTNPNTWESITANVTDSIDGGGTCTVTGGTGAVIAASSSSVFPYTCTYSKRPTLVSGTNTATATWNGTTAYTPHSAASGSAGYTFNTLTITDNVQSSAYPSGCTATLGMVSVTTTTPSASPGCGVTSLASSAWGVFTYSITDSNSSPGTCTSYNNTAQITGGTSSNPPTTVTVCNTNTGALTMGFWQNKNGQGIISGGGSTGGVCNSGTFLRMYAPFQDLSATASCSAEATYVYNIIKAANASGASMNAMLKAQMLATALDVYFSSPASGDPIKNYNGGITVSLGGVNIDLTKVCSMIDSSSGTGTCSGSFLNTSAAFGGMASLTASQILAYAASQSNAGGSVWYGNIKATQGLAKNTFDAINNQAAYIAP